MVICGKGVLDADVLDKPILVHVLDEPCIGVRRAHPRHGERFFGSRPERSGFMIVIATDGGETSCDVAQGRWARKLHRPLP